MQPSKLVGILFEDKFKFRCHLLTMAVKKRNKPPIGMNNVVKQRGNRGNIKCIAGKPSSSHGLCLWEISDLSVLGHSKDIAYRGNLHNIINPVFLAPLTSGSGSLEMKIKYNFL